MINLPALLELEKICGNLRIHTEEDASDLPCNFVNSVLVGREVDKRDRSFVYSLNVFQSPIKTDDYIIFSFAIISKIKDSKQNGEQDSKRDIEDYLVRFLNNVGKTKKLIKSEAIRYIIYIQKDLICIVLAKEVN